MRKKITPIQLPSESPKMFPSIKKPHSTTNSPKNALVSPALSQDQTFYFSPRSPQHLKNLNPDELLIKRFDENPNKLYQRENSSKAKIDLEYNTMKIKNDKISKILKEKDQYTKKLEKHIDTEPKLIINNSEIHHEIIIPSVRKFEETKVEDDNSINDEFQRKHYHRTNYKDQELHYMKEEIQELKEKIELNNKESASEKIKMLQMEDEMAALNMKLEENNKELTRLRTENQTYKRQSEENEIDSIFLKSELNDTLLSLKKSEEKRKLAIENTITLEKDFIKLKGNMKLKSKQVKELQAHLNTLTSSVLDKEAQIKDLLQQLSELQEKLDYEKNKYFSLNCELENEKLSQKSSEERYELNIVKYEQELKLLQDTLQSYKQQFNLRISSKRSETKVEKKYFAMISSEEISRWQDRYFAVEQKLLSKEHELEKITKDEAYIHSQLNSKNEIIRKLEEIVQSSEHSTMKTFNSSYRVNYFYEILSFLEKMSRRVTEISEILKCAACFKVKSECFQCVPCGHLCCKECREEVEGICAKCAERTSGMLPILKIDEFAGFTKEELNDIENIKSLVNGFASSSDTY